MDTNSKKIRYSGIFKLCAVFVALISSVMLSYVFLNIYSTVPVFEEDFYKSREFTNQYYKFRNAVANVIYYNDEASIREGTYISGAQKVNAENYVKNLIEETKLSIEEEYSILISQAETEEQKNILVNERNNKIIEAEKSYTGLYNKEINKLIESQLEDFIYFSNLIESMPFAFSVNVEPNSYGYTWKTGAELGLVSHKPIYSSEVYDFTCIDSSTMDSVTDIKIETTDDEFFEEIESFNAAKERGLRLIYIGITAVILALISLAWICATAGKTPLRSEIKLGLLDKIYLEFQIAITVVADMLLILPMALLIDSTYDSNTYYGDGYNNFAAVMAVAVGAVIIFAVMLFSGHFIVSNVKKARKDEFLKHTLIYAIFSLIKKIFSGVHALVFSKFRWKLFTACVLYSVSFVVCLVLMFKSVYTFLFFGGILLLLTVAAAAFFQKQFCHLDRMMKEVTQIRNGNPGTKVSYCGIKELDTLADDVNNLSDGLKRAVDSEVRSSKMKVELITNVSHDLKTPLTSIISYVDLLENEKDEDKQKKYIEIIKTKSARLKHLIEDLFELSKSESKIQPVTMEKLSINDMLAQVAAEYEEKIDELGLTLKINDGNEKHFVMADSIKLWRVFSNIFGNIIKYAMPATRVYIDIMPNGDFYNISFKNVSRYEMNFDAREITEKFKRGDESRTTEGSGLGLAIVDSFVKLIGGDCSIVVDGDLFKITIKLIKAL